MITGWDVYWITRLDVAQSTASCLAWLSFMVLAMVLFWLGIHWGTKYTSHEEGLSDFTKKYRKPILIPLICLLLFAFLSVVIPTTKEAVAIYMIPKIANNEQVQKLPDNALKFLNGKFEQWINDMADAKKPEK